MFGYPNAMNPMGMGQMNPPMQGQIYPNMQQGMPPGIGQGSNFGPQSPAVPSQGIGQGNYTPGPVIGLKIRPVASYDEAKAVPTDFAGNMIVMTDFSHNQIYTKILDPMTNAVTFQTYRRVEETEPTPPPIQPVTNEKPKEDVWETIGKLRSDLENIKRELGITDKGEESK